MKEKLGLGIWGLSAVVSVVSIFMAPHDTAPLVSLVMGIIVFLRTFSKSYRNSTVFPVSATAYLLYSAVVFRAVLTQSLGQTVTFAKTPVLVSVLILLSVIFTALVVVTQRKLLWTLWKRICGPR